MKILVLMLALAGDYPREGQSAQEGAVPPPPSITAAKQQPATAPPEQAVTLRLPSIQPSAQSLPIQADQPGPQVQILRVVHVFEQAPAPQPQPQVYAQPQTQAITMSVAPSAQGPVVVAPPASAVVTAKVHRPWLLRRAAGQVGDVTNECCRPMAGVRLIPSSGEGNRLIAFLRPVTSKEKVH
ncbi:hypothetical protein V5E97_10595 [Singulisphaera sp. Ch08]|uniref:Uncharacterized protein n=1 Tax=Singulisphaera sp. Ch08 TaxID=3120278 RepID=A0AAU7CLY1_9BACT